MHKWKKRLKTALFLCTALLLLGSTTILCIDSHVTHMATPQILTPEEAAELTDVDCILVLGCGAPNGVPGPMLTDRLNQSISLYQLGVSDRLLMSGDHGREGYDEVNAMKSFAMAANVPSEIIFMDHAGFSTYESMYRAREVFEAKRIVIVTQEYHIYRAVYIAQSLGLEAYGVPVEKSYPGQIYYNTREVLARNKDAILCLFAPPPSILGEAIPVSGNGNITNDLF